MSQNAETDPRKYPAWFKLAYNYAKGARKFRGHTPSIQEMYRIYFGGPAQASSELARQHIATIDGSTALLQLDARWQGRGRPDNLEKQHQTAFDVAFKRSMNGRTPRDFLHFDRDPKATASFTGRARVEQLVRDRTAERRREGLVADSNLARRDVYNAVIDRYLGGHLLRDDQAIVDNFLVQAPNRPYGFVGVSPANTRRLRRAAIPQDEVASGFPYIGMRRLHEAILAGPELDPTPEEPPLAPGFVSPTHARVPRASTPVSAPASAAPPRRDIRAEQAAFESLLLPFDMARRERILAEREARRLLGQAAAEAALQAERRRRRREAAAEFEELSSAGFFGPVAELEDEARVAEATHTNDQEWIDHADQVEARLRRKRALDDVYENLEEYYTQPPVPPVRGPVGNHGAPFVTPAQAAPPSFHAPGAATGFQHANPRDPFVPRNHLEVHPGRRGYHDRRDVGFNPAAVLRPGWGYELAQLGWREFDSLKSTHVPIEPLLRMATLRGEARSHLISLLRDRPAELFPANRDRMSVPQRMRLIMPSRNSPMFRGHPSEFADFYYQRLIHEFETLIRPYLTGQNLPLYSNEYSPEYERFLMRLNLTNQGL